MAEVGDAAGDRAAKARALQDALVARYARERGERAAEAPPPGATLVEGLAPGEAGALGALDLHARRYGIAHPTRASLRRMGCRTVADAAATPYRKAVDWLGYREADLLRQRLAEILAEVRAGAPEPGVTRMAEGLDDGARAWLAARPVEDIAGRGITRKVAAALRAVGIETLLSLATEEADGVEDIQGIGGATVAALRTRLAGILAEGKDAPSRRRLRSTVAEDAEWDDAAPTRLRRRGRGVEED
jgi:hypothetical protein